MAAIDIALTMIAVIVVCVFLFGIAVLSLIAWSKAEQMAGKQAVLLDSAETLLCNAFPMAHCTQGEWDELITNWRNQKHALK